MEASKNLENLSVGGKSDPFTKSLRHIHRSLPLGERGLRYLLCGLLQNQGLCICASVGEDSPCLDMCIDNTT